MFINPMKVVVEVDEVKFAEACEEGLLYRGKPYKAAIWQKRVRMKRNEWLRGVASYATY